MDSNVIWGDEKIIVFCDPLTELAHRGLDINVLEECERGGGGYGMCGENPRGEKTGCPIALDSIIARVARLEKTYRLTKAIAVDGEGNGVGVRFKGIHNGEHPVRDYSVVRGRLEGVRDFHKMIGENSRSRRIEE
jgi:hypothetical protein